MDGTYNAGWYEHPSHGLIKVYQNDLDWVYRCYTKNGQKPLSKERKMDQWIWALSEAAAGGGPTE